MISPLGFSKVTYFLGMTASDGEGNQCATMTANGAKIAAAVAWLIQKAAIAGVAAFASEVSTNTTVGR